MRSPLVLLLGYHLRLGLRDLPQGGIARLRGALVFVALTGFFLYDAAGPTYRRLSAALVWAYRHDTAGLTLTLTRASTGLAAVCIALAAGLVVRFAHTPDIRALALTPLGPWTILAARLCEAGAVLVGLALVGSLPLFILAARNLGLGVAYALAATALVAAAPLLPLAAGALIGILLLRYIPSSRVRALGALIGPLLVWGDNAVALVTGSAPAGLLELSPFAWSGRALLAVLPGHGGTATLYGVAALALSIALLWLAARASRGLFLAGWTAYMGLGSVSSRPRRAGPTLAARPAARRLDTRLWPASLFERRAPGLRAVACLVATHEWRVVRRDSVVWLPLLFGLIELLVAWAAGVSAAAALPGGTGATPRDAIPLEAIGALYGALSTGIGLILYIAVPTTLSRHAPAVLSAGLAPLRSRYVVLAMAGVYAIPVGLIGIGLGLAGAVALRLGAGVALIGSLALACITCLEACALLLASLRWPTRPDPARAAPTSLMARVAGAIMDAGILGILGGVFLLAAAVAPGAPLLAAVLALAGGGVTVGGAALCLYGGARALDALLVHARNPAG